MIHSVLSPSLAASLFLLGFPGMGYRIYKDWK
jgi:hypothetical protein